MRFEVNRDKGWPIGAEIYPFGEQFDSDNPTDVAAVEQSYLFEVATGFIPTPEPTSATTPALEPVDDDEPPVDVIGVNTSIKKK